MLLELPLFLEIIVWENSVLDESNGRRKIYSAHNRSFLSSAHLIKANRMRNATSLAFQQFTPLIRSKKGSHPFLIIAVKMAKSLSACCGPLI